MSNYGVLHKRGMISRECLEATRVEHNSAVESMTSEERDRYKKVRAEMEAKSMAP